MKEYPQTLMGYYLKNWRAFSGGLVVLWAILWVPSYIAWNMQWPLFSKYFIAVLETGGAEMVGRGLALVMIFGAVWALQSLMCVFREMLNRRWSARSRNQISEHLNDYVFSQSAQWYGDRMPGKIGNQIGLVAAGFKDLFYHITGFAAKIVIMMVGFGMIFSVDWRIGAIMLVGSSSRLIWLAVVSRGLFRADKALSEAASTLTGRLTDSVSNFMVVKLFAAAAREKTMMGPDRKRVMDATIDAKYKSYLLWFVPGLIENLAGFGVALLLLYLGVGGHIRISDAVFSFMIYIQFIGIMWDISTSLPDVLEDYATAAEAYNKLISPVSVRDEAGAKTLAVRRGAIDIRGVSFGYGRDRGHILRDFSLAIRPGEKVGLVGVSGSGKTTLVNLVMRLYDPKKGRIEIDGQNIRRVTQDSLRQKIAFIPQDSVLFHRTLAENIGYGRDNAAPGEIIAAAKKAGAHDFIMKAPHKYETLVGDRGIKLSGGQRQRVAIARAILKNAPILIMDEATSALDSETERLIQKSFNEISRGKTTIVIAHRLSTLRHMDRIVVMSRGQIAESGTHSELVAKNGLYARLWKMQSDGFINQ
ncbi:MAG: ABC transporter ATP-binding protein/permease [Rickettsiales bacterium]|jgi:ATP-binding cassette subfamily B protein|nr:ABC transporter ATP-binding protein/permease [Rickettsiales bacterium]